MGKNGLLPKEWWERLRGLAAGTFKFRKGQAPRKDSKWNAYIVKIKSCPLTANPKALKKDLFGQPVKCTCSFHPDRNAHQVDNPTAQVALKPLDQQVYSRSIPRQVI